MASNLFAAPARWRLLVLACVLASLLVPVLDSASTIPNAETRVRGLDLVNHHSTTAIGSLTLGTHQGYALGYDDFASGSLLAARAATSFRSFSSLKRVLGPAGEGRQWHHVVEQSQVGRFGPEAIHNVENVYVPGTVVDVVSAVRRHCDPHSSLCWSVMASSTALTFASKPSSSTLLAAARLTSRLAVSTYFASHHATSPMRSARW